MHSSAHLTSIGKPPIEVFGTAQQQPNANTLHQSMRLVQRKLNTIPVRLDRKTLNPRSLKFPWIPLQRCLRRER
eukprot:5922350-Amphidinium_carterae.1